MALPQWSLSVTRSLGSTMTEETGQVAGAGRGIGAAVELAVAGARVLAVDLHKERADETVATITAQAATRRPVLQTIPSDDAPETIVQAAVDAYGSAGANQFLSTHTHASGFDRRLLHTAVQEEKQCLP